MIPTRVARRLVADIDTPPGTLIRVFCDDDLPFPIREGAINHPRLSDTDVNAFMAADSDEIDGALVVGLTNRSAVLARWSDSPNPLVRALIAFNPNTPGSCVSALAEDRDPRVRFNAALNPRLTRSARVAIALHDPNPVVRNSTVTCMTTREGRTILSGVRYVTDTAQEAEGTDRERATRLFGIGLDAEQIPV